MSTLGPISRDSLNNFLLNSCLHVQYGFTIGFIIGGYTSGHRAALQFLAENQHEMPRGRAQELIYRRNRNYKVMAGVGVGGFKRGLQLALVGAAFSAVKKALEAGREHEIINKFTAHFDDLVAGTLLGSSLFLISSILLILLLYCHYIHIYVYYCFRSKTTILPF